MAAVMIGVDPHKGSHTAAAIGAAAELLGDVGVRASAAQAEQLVAWAAAWPRRTWAIEGATGLGNLLAQQLAAAGERVWDVQPKVAARVRDRFTTHRRKYDDALPLSWSLRQLACIATKESWTTSSAVTMSRTSSAASRTSAR
jgi:hypothetical protein